MPNAARNTRPATHATDRVTGRVLASIGAQLLVAGAESALAQLA